MLYILLIIIIFLLIKLVYFSESAITKRAVKRFNKLFGKDLSKKYPEAFVNIRGMVVQKGSIFDRMEKNLNKLNGKK